MKFRRLLFPRRKFDYFRLYYTPLMSLPGAPICESASNSSLPHSSLLRMLNSEMCTLEIRLSYLYRSKDSSVHSSIINSLKRYSNDEIDFYLPQLVCLFIGESSPALTRGLKSYFLKRAQESERFVLLLIWCLESFSGQHVSQRFQRSQNCSWQSIGRTGKINQIEQLVDQLAICLRLQGSHRNSLSDLPAQSYTSKQLFFIESLVNIGTKLVKVNPSKRGSDLVFALNDLNIRLLPGHYFVPVVGINEDHVVARIVSHECKILNSKTRV
ncbi:hypothetical protein ACOME3_007362 [Neoechinorhynchus agilis]